MSRTIKFILYPIIFLLSFVLFLYWFFPYDAVKERVTGSMEKALGGGLEVSIQKLEPYWFTGIDVEGLTVGPPGGDKAAALLSCRRMRARAGLLSLLVGSPSVSFDVEIGKGEIAGSVRQSEETLAVDADIDDLDLASLRFIAARTGLNLSSQIDGEISLRIDRPRPLQSVGTVTIELLDLKLAPSELKIAGSAMPLPELVLAKGRESQVKLEIGKGTVSFENLRLTGGDLGIDIKGKLFLSAKAENYRFNLNGAFTVSKKLSDAVPFLFIIEQQKQEDGSYPIAVTGRLGKPSIKVGTFTVPL